MNFANAFLFLVSHLFLIISIMLLIISMSDPIHVDAVKELANSEVDHAIDIFKPTASGAGIAVQCLKIIRKNNNRVTIITTRLA